MALGRQGQQQVDLMVGWAELPRSPGHAFYDRLQAILTGARFDGFAEEQCATVLRRQATGRAMKVPPGNYSRQHRTGSVPFASRRASASWLLVIQGTSSVPRTTGSRTERQPSWSGGTNSLRALPFMRNPLP